VCVKYLTKAVGIFLKFLWGGRLVLEGVGVLQKLKGFEFYKNIVVLE
jgi:hypothetical protein